MKNTHFMSTVKIGPKGQIVIPIEIRKMFDLEPGDNLLIMADINRGIGIQKQSVLENISNMVFSSGEGVPPEISPDFANAVKTAIEKGSAEK